MDNTNNNNTNNNIFTTNCTIIKNELQDMLERVKQIEDFIREIDKYKQSQQIQQRSRSITSMTNFYLPTNYKEDSDEIGEPLQKKIKIKR